MKALTDPGPLSLPFLRAQFELGSHRDLALEHVKQCCGAAEHVQSIHY